jgi:hypothetical protein
MCKPTTPRRCGRDVPTRARVAVDALIVHHLNPLLQGRQACAKRVEEMREKGDVELAMGEELALLCLESAYRDGLKLLRWLLAPCKEPIQ